MYLQRPSISPMSKHFGAEPDSLMGGHLYWGFRAEYRLTKTVGYLTTWKGNSTISHLSPRIAFPILDISAKTWSLHTCLYMRLLTFLQNMSYYIYVTCLWPSFISGRGGDGGGLTGEKVVKDVTTVRTRVSTFVSVKPLDIFDKGASPA